MKALKIIAGILLLFALPAYAQVPPTANGKFAEVNGANIYYEEFGSGEPLILLHGFGRTADDWKPYILEFSKTYRVIAWDMRGHGRSSTPDTGIVFLHATAARDLIALMDQLEIDTANVIGHSSGGIVALYAASETPHRFEAIVPISAQTNFSSQTRDFIKNNCTPEEQFKYNDLEALHGRVIGQHLAEQFYHFHVLEGDPDITTDRLKRITARTLVIHGDNDFIPIKQALDIHENINGAHLWIVPNGWHLPHTGTNTEEFTKKTMEFLNNAWK